MTGHAIAIRDQFKAFAEIYAPEKSPLYARLSRIVMDNDALLDLAAAARPGQPAPNMLFAATHMVLLYEDINHPLADYYPSAGGTLPPGAPKLVDVYAGFCAKHENRLRHLIRTRVTNTNEVRRCACLMPAFAAVARHFGQAPFHLVEIGPGAGFNLWWDRYVYRYQGPDSAPVILGEEAAPGALVLDCALRGAAHPSWPETWPPELASRIGIERDPVDLGCEEDRRWLRALIWPEQGERAERLERALAIMADAPPPVRTGDALDLLPQVLADLPPGAPACVSHSFVFAQFSKEQRARVRNMLAEAAADRPLCRIAMEGHADRPDAFLGLEIFPDGRRVRLAFCDPHGSWIEWRAIDTAHSADDPP